MNERFVPAKAVSSPRIREPNDFYAQFRLRQDALSVVRQLNHLSSAVQCHRGMSMALLAGSSDFQEGFAAQQAQITRRLISLGVFVAQLKHVALGRDLENLNNAWQTISVDWQQDDVIDNFELHSHFIAQLQIMNAKLAETLERPVSAMAAGLSRAGWPEQAPDCPKLAKRVQLLDCATKHIPMLVEQVARVRGLSTFAAARGHCDHHHEKKLRYEIARVRISTEKVRYQTERLEQWLGAHLTELAPIKAYELKLSFLLNTVEMDILSGTTISSSSHQLFQLASEIIDAYLNLEDEAIGLLGRWHEDDLEQWLCSR